jgi:adenosylhomocysteine nucleosidase
LTPNVVGIVCALAAEARHLGRTTRLHEPLALLADGTLLAVTGMGAGAAALGARALIDAGATALASWGMAGGLDPSLPPGAIFLPSEIVSPDGAAILTARPWRERLSAALAAHHPMNGGKLLTSPTAVGSTTDKHLLFHNTRAAAVDMESFAIAQVAAAHDCPFVAVRVIVDGAADVLPKAVTAAADSAGHLHLWRLIGALAMTPSDLAPLLRLSQRYRAASRSLAVVANIGLT